MRWVVVGALAALVGVATVPGVQAASPSATPTAVSSVVPFTPTAAFRMPVFGGTGSVSVAGMDGYVVGTIEAVNRVDGGSVLYYTAAVDETAFAAGLSNAYLMADATGTQLAATARLLAPQSDSAYSPLTTGTSAPAEVGSAVDDFAWTGAGQLQVGYLVFPTLPSAVTHVWVQFGSGRQVVGPIPVGSGTLSPVVTTMPITWGEGWPKVPQGQDLAGTVAADHTYPLYWQSGTSDGASQTSQGAGQVVTTLGSDVLFAKDSADLSSAAQATLAETGADIAKRGTGTVTVTGYTDSDGTVDYNLDLAQRRAQAVVDAMTPLSGSAVTFTVVSKGEADPVADNSTPEGKQANRRVTVSYGVTG